MSEQSWNAFDDSIGTLPLENTQQSSQQEVISPPPSSFVDQYLDTGVSEVSCSFYLIMLLC